MVENFKNAVEIWRAQERGETREQIGNMIKEMWSQLGSIDVRCPHCNTKMTIHTLRSKKCYSCGKTFSIYPKNAISRIVPSSVPPNKLAILHNIRSLETTGQFVSI
jgi:transposase-like protein